MKGRKDTSGQELVGTNGIFWTSKDTIHLVLFLVTSNLNNAKWLAGDLATHPKGAFPYLCVQILIKEDILQELREL